MTPTRSTQAERHPASPAHFDPMPQAVVRDLEAIRRGGKPERAAWMLVGESELILAIPLVGFAALFVLTVVFGIIHNLSTTEKHDYRDVFLAGFAIAFLTGFVLYFIAKAIKPLIYVFLNIRAGGDRLCTDRRVFMYACEEGLVWHDVFGLRYFPWRSVSNLALEDGTSEQGTTLRFTDARSGEQQTLRSALMFNRKDVRAIHAEIARRLAPGAA
ncbi:MAG: hypothetical protein KIS92_03830 [Planctomycetota bacterium]|nr:hypothetical protein [Planctomycetota bacterium]